MLTHHFNKLIFPLCLLVIVFNTSFSGAEGTPVFRKAPLNPEFVRYVAQNKMQSKTADDSRESMTGYMPSPVALECLTSKASSDQISTSLRGKSQLPSRYDLRTKNKLTPVKEQVIETCWAFATYASLESCLLPRESWDFSENHLRNKNGFDWINVGNGYVATAYLARWGGPIAESADPYNPKTRNSLGGVMPVKHIQNIVWLPQRTSATDNGAIKNAVIKKGAVFVAYHHDSTYYRASTSSFCYNGTGVNNHSVAIVGWDDNFSKSNFATPPSGNGAFIVRNSWGTQWGENGYYYVSYYDTKFGYIENIQFAEAEPTTNYSQIYQYDPLGCTATWGFDSTTAWMANIFTATKTAMLKAVSFYTLSPGNTYTIQIYTGVGSIPTSGALVATRSGSFEYAGYHTIPLPTSVALLGNQKFSVVVKLTTNGSQFPITIEDPEVDFSSKAKAGVGQSYISPNGTKWTELLKECPNGNVCLKAFTK